MGQCRSGPDRICYQVLYHLHCAHHRARRFPLAEEHGLSPWSAYSPFGQRHFPGPNYSRWPRSLREIAAAQRRNPAQVVL